MLCYFRSADEEHAPEEIYQTPGTDPPQLNDTNPQFTPAFAVVVGICGDGYALDSTGKCAKTFSPTESPGLVFDFDGGKRRKRQALITPHSVGGGHCSPGYGQASNGQCRRIFTAYQSVEWDITSRKKRSAAESADLPPMVTEQPVPHTTVFGGLCGRGYTQGPGGTCVKTFQPGQPQPQFELDRNRKRRQTVGPYSVAVGRCSSGYRTASNGQCKKIFSAEPRSGGLPVPSSAAVSICPVGYIQDRRGRCRKTFPKTTRSRPQKFDFHRKKRSETAPQENVRPGVAVRPGQVATDGSNVHAKVFGASCKKGFVEDKHGGCVKTFKQTVNTPGLVLDVDESRKRRSTSCPPEFHPDASGNCRKKLSIRISKPGIQPRVVSSGKDHHVTSFRRGGKETSTSTTTEKNKNAAGDGFGFVSKDCSALVPGLVSDGAGGCTKAVKPKEKILKVDRKKRAAEEMTYEGGARKDLLQVQVQAFTDGSEDPNEDANKGIASEGFGFSSFKCSSLVPGFVSDGAGGCTKLVKNKKKNKLANQFVFKNSEVPLLVTDKLPDWQPEGAQAEDDMWAAVVQSARLEYL